MEQLSFISLAVTLTLFIVQIVTREIYGESSWKNIGNFTLVERNAIDKFRTMVGPELYLEFMRTDQYLILWIRDQKFNLPNAEAKLLRSLKWRKDNKIDTILEEDYSEQFKLCPYDASSRDREGRPVITSSIANCAMRKLILSGDINKLKRVFHQRSEKFLSIVNTIQQNEGRNITDVITLTNYHGFNLREYGCIKCFLLNSVVATLYEEHYPESIFRAIIVNMPRVAETLVTFIKPFLSEKTKAVYDIYGYNKEEWRAELLKLIPADQLEIQFGGTKTITNGYAYSNKLK